MHACYNIRVKRKQKELKIMNYVMYVGLNDQDTKKQEVTTELAMECIGDTVGDCTLSMAQGRYTHANGVAVRENTVRVELFDKEEQEVKRYCEVLKKMLNQESIAVQEVTEKSMFF